MASHNSPEDDSLSRNM